MKSNRSFGNDQDEEIVDAQNRLLTENLSHKVSRLKSLAFDIESETKEHTLLLDGLGSDFESGSGLLSGSMNRIHSVLNSGRGNRRAMCYMVAMIVGVFMLIYLTLPMFNRPAAN